MSATLTLGQMVDSVCLTVNHTEVEDKEAAKSYLTNRHSMLWNESLWKDSLVEYVQSLTADYTVLNNWLPSVGTLILPAGIQRVLAARTACRALNVQRPEFYYRRDFDSFSQNGQATEFVLLSPCIWQFETAQIVKIALDDGDVNCSPVIDTLDSNGVDITRFNTTPVSDGTIIATTTRIDSFSKMTTAVEVELFITGASDIFSILAPTATNSPKRQRLQLVQNPAASAYPITIRVLGKRVVPDFIDDNDTPAISGCENALLALGRYDMLIRDRQYGRAASMMQAEIAPLIDQLKKQETIQQAFYQRIQPADGASSDQWFPNPIWPLIY